jgi:two-component system sensor histidine kinase BaeS
LERPPFAEGADDRRPPPRLSPRTARQTRIDALNLPTRVALLDDRNRIVIGNPAVPLDSPRVPINVEGRLIGSLLLAPQPALNNDIDVAFVRSQSQHAVSAAVAILLVALAAALLLARWLLAPVKQLGERMEQLAAGNFAERISSSRADELGALARNYNRLADTLAKNQEARRQWGADIAHELRTPLSILRGEIQALQDGVRPVSKSALDSLQSECARLTSLVDDLYQLALSDAGALSYRFESVDINAIIRETEADFAASFQDAGLVLTTALSATPLTVRADSQRLSQLLSNLLVNSQRYTDARGNVCITSSARREGSHDWIDVVIDDSPPGVAPELLPKLFDRLFRVETSRSRAAGGAGLGLAICKNIAAAHGGTLIASASPLGGVRMRLSLPMFHGAAA